MNEKREANNNSEILVMVSGFTQMYFIRCSVVSFFFWQWTLVKAVTSKLLMNFNNLLIHSFHHSYFYQSISHFFCHLLILCLLHIFLRSILVLLVLVFTWSDVIHLCKAKSIQFVLKLS